MNKPPVLNALLVPLQDAERLGSVEAPVLASWLRPVSLGLWVFVFASQALAMVITGEGNYLLIGLITLLFLGVQLQYWYEESQQALGLRQTMERLRGQVFEDDTTGLPNSRHFLAELRRQMLRSTRTGQGFSLVLLDVVGWGNAGKVGDDLLDTIARRFRRALGDTDFVARLEGPVFAGIVTDSEASVHQKYDTIVNAMPDGIPPEFAGRVRIVTSITPYEGEEEVRAFVRRAHQDLLRARTGSGAPPMEPVPMRRPLAS